MRMRTAWVPFASVPPSPRMHHPLRFLFSRSVVLEGKSCNGSALHGFLIFRFELFEFARKLMLIGVLTAVSQTSQAYLNVAHTVSFFSLIVFANCRPFVEPRLDRCARVAAEASVRVRACVLAYPRARARVCMRFCCVRMRP
jgi:hypothetical protein